MSCHVDGRTILGSASCIYRGAPTLPFFIFYFSKKYIQLAGRPGSSEVSRNPLTRWDVSSIPANGIFLTKKLKN